MNSQNLERLLTNLYQTPEQCFEEISKDYWQMIIDLSDPRSSFQLEYFEIALERFWFAHWNMQEP